ncbi:MAG: hypothetical protein H7099_09990 [Gemmatimonadaceae bacterium]|nr:hypothetical protein [Gemmatimonadaceae bacterium]
MDANETTPEFPMRRSSIPSLSLAIVVLLAGCARDAATAPLPDDALPSASIDANGAGASRIRQALLLAKIAAATAKYQRESVAVNDGYTFITPCFFSAVGLGARGQLYRKTPLLDGLIDPKQPEILLYEPQEDGQMKLVGVHFVVLAAPWDAANPGVVPMLGSEPLRDRRAPGAAPFPSYSIFVALWRRNPSGLYADFNPAVSCKYAAVSVPQ